MKITLATFALAATLLGSIISNQSLVYAQQSTPTPRAGGTAQTSSNARSAGFGAPLSRLIADEGGFVSKSWRATRAVINIILILALLAISFTNILRINISNYEVKKALPSLVIGVILANASYLIIKFMVDINQVAVQLFVDLAGRSSFADFVSFVVERLTSDTVMFVISADPISAGGAAAGALFILVALIVVLVGFVWMAFLLYFRLIAVYLLTIISPLAFIAYGIPGLDKYFKQWWKEFIKWLFMLVPMAAVFWLMTTISTADPQQQSLAELIIVYVLFFMAVTIPTKLGGKVMSQASSVFMKYSGAGAARDASIQAAKNVGERVKSRTGIYRVQEWNKLRKENFEKTLENRRLAAKAKASSGKVGQRSAKLDWEKQVFEGELATVLSDQSVKTLSDEISKKINEVNTKKTISEQDKSIALTEKKMSFLKPGSDDKDIKELLEKFAVSSSRSAALTEGVSSLEKIITGGYTNKRVDALKTLEAKKYLESKLKEVADEEAKLQQAWLDAQAKHGRGSREDQVAQLALDQYQKDTNDNYVKNSQQLADAEAKFEKVKIDHNDLKNLSSEQAAKIMFDDNEAQGEIWKSELKKQRSAYDKGVVAQSEDARLEGSIEQLEREYASFFKTEFNPVIEKLTSGQTVGLDIKTQREFHLITATLKEWMKSNRNPNYDDGIIKSLKMIVEQGGQEIKLLNKDGQREAINQKQLEEIIMRINNGRMGQAEKQAIVREINRNAGFAGTPSSRVDGVRQ